MAQSPGEKGSIADAGGIEQSGTIEPTRVLSRKVIAIIVVIIVISASTCAIWYFYFRHWSASELADRLVRSEIGGYSGYDDDLAGKSVVVEGKVTSIERYDTALGTATVVELDEVDESSLVFWSNVSYELGETISRRVHFEWAFWNDEKHVYSPEVWLQFGYALGAAAIADAVSYVGSNGGFTRVSNVDSDVRIEIGWLGEPAELGTTNCTLVSGTRSGSADVYYIYDSEGQHNETDTINNLTYRIGHNNTIEFNDENDDGYLDNGDWFVLKNLTRPDTESGIKTYMFRIYWPLSPDMDPDHVPFGLWCYIPVLKDGAATPVWWNDQSLPARNPYVRAFLEAGDEAQIMTIDCVGGDIPWENVTVQLSDGTNFAEWEPTTVDSVGDSLGTKKLGSLDVETRVIHTAGTNKVSAGDRIQIRAVSPSEYSKSAVYTLALVEEGTRTWMTQRAFCFNDTPVAGLRPTTWSEGGVVNGTAFTFTPIHVGVNSTYRPFDLPWHNLILNLSDGVNNVSWTTSTNLLHMGFGIGMTFGKLALGSLNVTLFVWDLNGDGQVNNGDRIELITPDAAGFDVSTTYSLTAIYAYAGTDMCSVEFTG